MSANRESWTKIGGVISIACGCAGLSFGVLHFFFPNGGFSRDLFMIGSVLGTGLICSSLFPGQARIRYLTILSTICVVGIAGVCALKFALKDVVAAAFSASKMSIDYSKDPDAPDLRDIANYWKEY